MRIFGTLEMDLHRPTLAWFIFLVMFSLGAFTSAACLGTNVRGDRSLKQETNRDNNETTPALSNAQDGLKLIITVEQKEWSRGQPIWVNLVVQNGTASKVQGSTAFDLVPREAKGPNNDWYSFWGPVDLAKDPPTPARAAVPFVIEGGKEVKRRIDLSQLKWGRLIQAVWPHADLLSLVPPGSYDLNCAMEIQVKGGANRIKSNAVGILIK